VTGQATRAAALKAATARLAAAGIEGAARDARLLMRHASGLEAVALSAALDAPMGAAEAARFDALVARRAARAPLSHVTGAREFWGRRFAVSAAVLDPRPETEVLVGWALEEAAPAQALDLGVGSGCILLSLLAAWPQAQGLGVDASAAALELARANAAALGLGARARFAQGDWLRGVAGRFGVIVANPPYLTAAEMAALPPEVRAEPALALDGGPDGLCAYRAIAAGLADALTPGGAALFEVGAGQAQDVAAILARTALGPVETRADLDGRARVLRLRRDAGPRD